MNGVIEVKLAVQDDQRPVQAKRGERVINHTVEQPASGRWALYRHRWTTRRALRGLTDDELLDIGLSVQQARIEAGKPFWRA